MSFVILSRREAPPTLAELAAHLAPLGLELGPLLLDHLVVASPRGAPWSARIELASCSGFPAPKVPLAPPVRAAFDAARQAITIHVPRFDPGQALFTVRLIDPLFQALDGVVLDTVSSRVWGRTEWAARLPGKPFDVRAFITVLVAPLGKGRVYVRTSGLTRFDRLELELLSVKAKRDDVAVALLNSLAAHSVEKAPLLPQNGADLGGGITVGFLDPRQFALAADRMKHPLLEDFSSGRSLLVFDAGGSDLLAEDVNDALLERLAQLSQPKG